MKRLKDFATAEKPITDDFYDEFDLSQYTVSQFIKKACQKRIKPIWPQTESLYYCSTCNFMEFDTQDALEKHYKSEKHVVRPDIFTLFTSLQGQYFLRITYFSQCVKSVRIRSFSGPYFPAFGLNTERYSVSLRIQSESIPPYLVQMWVNVGKYGPEKL